MILFKITKENNYHKSANLKIRTHQMKTAEKVNSEFKVLTVPFA
jgi:hypothetical protein